MASLTSESDSNTFVREMQHHHCHTVFFSLTTNMNRDSQNPRVPGVPDGKGDIYGVRVHNFLLLAICQFPFVCSQWPV